MISFTRTIGYRLWLACVLVITIPLGVNITYLSLFSYRQNKDVALKSLQTDAALKKISFESIIPFNKEILSLMIDVLDLNEYFPTEVNPTLSEALSKLFHTNYDTLAVIKFSPNNNLSVIASNTDIPMNIENLSLKFENSLHHQLELRDTEPFIVFQANVFDTLNHQPLGCIYAETKLSSAIESSSPINPSNVHYALISEKGSVLSSSDALINTYSFHNQENTSHVKFIKDSPSPEEQVIYISKTSLGNHFVTFNYLSKPMLGFIQSIPELNTYLLTFTEYNTNILPIILNNSIYIIYSLLLIISILLAYIVTKQLTYPIQSLANIMIQSKNNMQIRYKKHFLGFEINELGENFNLLLNNLDKQKELALTNFAKKEEQLKVFEIGTIAQQSLLPKEVPTCSHIEIAKTYIPAKNVSGDFFDIFMLEKNNEQLLFVIVADASGKGVHACGFSLFLKNTLHIFLSHKNSIEEAVQATASIFYEHAVKDSMFVTLCIYCIHCESKTISYYSCGHNPGFHINNNQQITTLSHPGMALGFVPDIPPIKTNTFKASQESYIILYSDGITEAQNNQQEMFGEERFKHVIASITGLSAEQALQNIMHEIKQFVEDNVQYDDITLIVLKIL